MREASCRGAWVDLAAGTVSNSGATIWYVASEMLMRPASPEDSRRAATLTASPQTSNANLFFPITPAMTGPVWMPRASPRRSFPHGRASRPYAS